MIAIKPILVGCLACIALAYPSGQKAHATDMSPVDVVRTGIAELAEAKSEHGSHGDGDKQGLVNAVRLFLSEYTDIHYAARLILSSHWDAASPEQRERFAAAFNNLIVNRLVMFIPDIEFASVRVDPFTGDIEDTPLMIKATFRKTDNQVINFVLVTHKKGGRWLIFDVVAEGVSYVKTYRNQVSGEIAEVGLDAMLSRFERRSTSQGKD